MNPESWTKNFRGSLLNSELLFCRYSKLSLSYLLSNNHVGVAADFGVVAAAIDTSEDMRVV